MLFAAGPDFTALLKIFSHQIPLRDGCGLGKRHPTSPPPPTSITWDSGWRNVADFGRSSTPFSLPALRLSLPSSSHAQLSQNIYRGEIWASVFTPYLRRRNLKPNSSRQIIPAAFSPLLQKTFQDVSGGLYS